MSKQLEIEEDALHQAYDRGEISLKELQKEIRELYRDYRAAAHEAAQDAYDREMDNW